MTAPNVAVVGATGAVGEAMREILAERRFPFGAVRLLASERSAGKRLPVGDRTFAVQVLEDFDFADTRSRSSPLAARSPPSMCPGPRRPARWR